MDLHNIDPDFTSEAVPASVVPTKALSKVCVAHAPALALCQCGSY